MPLSVGSRNELVKQHQPGDSHEYDLTCKVCGQTGQITIAVEPQASFVTERDRLIADIRKHLPYVAMGHPELATQIEDALKQVEVKQSDS